MGERNEKVMKGMNIHKYNDTHLLVYISVQETKTKQNKNKIRPHGTGLSVILATGETEAGRWRLKASLELNEEHLGLEVEVWLSGLSNRSWLQTPAEGEKREGREEEEEKSGAGGMKGLTSGLLL